MTHWKHAAPDTIPPPGHWQLDFDSWFGLPALDGKNFALPAGKLGWARLAPSLRDTDEVGQDELADFRRDRTATSSTPAKPNPPPAPRRKAPAPVPRPADVPPPPTDPKPAAPSAPPPRGFSAPPQRPPPMRTQPRAVPTIPNDARFFQAFVPPRHPDLFNPQAQTQQSFHTHYENLIFAMQAQLAEHIAESVD